ncbi:GNAT family N-acetyltransferase [Mycetocola spongiae]|uniref:GNAT family N-acetyltransferase n=1 Tax=Mycetocola spongiae TaxID=2859226 RepID=UPI001CF3A4C2|nr:GNAT family N-acetyltransferase [Mycetocola spongiae]UCR89700.1 GNAT family N-acetyltransferase [Mycetocola spongiae]
MVILRYPSRLVALADRVAPVGWRVLPAGSLMYWETHTSDYRAIERIAGIEVLVFRGDEFSGSPWRRPTLDLLKDSFNGYVNHYAANGRFEHSAVTEGYLEWAQNTLLDHSGIAYLLLAEGVPVGAAIISEFSELSVHEVELAAIGSRFQRQGLYRHLLDGIIAGAAAGGIKRAVISTQSYNLNVQRAWARAGLVPALAVETAHLVRR